MIDILFRGKSIDNHEWVYGYFVQNGKESYIFKQQEVDKGLDLDGWLDACRMNEVIPETVGQFIGEYDSNDHRIFEGDVIKDSYGHHHRLEWDEDRFGYWPFILGILYPPRCTIVGNIYDNPELLEVK